MVRSFAQHKIRPSAELSGLWRFTPLEGPFAGQSRPAPVPGCWESLPGLEGYEGRAVYETRFEAAGSIRLRFCGVSHTADVYLDGERLARHYNAYTPFEAVAEGLAPGTHTLRVEVSNILDESSALHIPNDYYTYGGIIRPVQLQQLACAYIHHVHATPVCEKGEWQLRITAEVRALGDGPQSPSIEFALPGVAKMPPILLRGFAAGRSQVVELTLPCPGITPHEPGRPSLYLLETTLLDGGAPIDDLIERVGFREIRTEGETILWNGTPLRIHGFNRHEDHPAYGSALPFAAMMQDLALAQDMGANAIRTSHYPNDELFLDLCDELGLLVWEENHARGLVEERMRNPHFRPQALLCIDEMVEAHYNHPCIFIWGILNECASETEYGRICYAEQLARLRELDSSRPVSFASFRFDDDICLDLADVVSYNLYPGWYTAEAPADAVARQYAFARQNGGAGKPFLVTEIGAGGIPGCHSPARTKWSEERQADILAAQLSAVLGFAPCSGVFIWQFCDVRVHESWMDKRPRCMNNKGVVDEYRRPKLAYGVVKEIFKRDIE